MAGLLKWKAEIILDWVSDELVRIKKYYCTRRACKRSIVKYYGHSGTDIGHPINFLKKRISVLSSPLAAASLILDTHVTI